jgi:ssDNA-binding Zn-finger/Zn-ribbon topoisomerase 1
MICYYCKHKMDLISHEKHKQLYKCNSCGSSIYTSDKKSKLKENRDE